jgi:hypothetical protein
MMITIDQFFFFSHCLVVLDAEAVLYLHCSLVRGSDSQTNTTVELIVEDGVR